MGPFLSEAGLHALEVKDGGAAVFAGGHEDRRRLPVEQGDGGHPLRRKAPEVHLGVPGVVHGDPVQEDGRMGAAEAADIDGLQAADPAVILHLQPPGTLQGLRDADAPPEPLRRHRIGRRRHPALRDTGHPRRRQRIRNLLPGKRTGGQERQGQYERNQRITS